MDAMKATNVTWHEGHVDRDQRSRSLGQRGATLWLTGLSASGKSTIAFTLEHLLIEHGWAAYVLDGDNLRHGLNKNLGFSAEDRAEKAAAAAEAAAEAAKAPAAEEAPAVEAPAEEVAAAPSE